jgi:tetratricopeptide (TPR) repeat protein
MIQNCTATWGDALQTLGNTGTAGAFSDASAAYQRALQLNPNLSRGWYSAGCTATSLKEYVAAIDCFQRALSIQPDWPPAQHNLGQVLFNLGQVETALDCFVRELLLNIEDTGPSSLLLAP